LIAKMARITIYKRRMKNKDKKYVEAWANQFSLVQPHIFLSTNMIRGGKETKQIFKFCESLCQLPL
jgi:hypothetical protein